MQDLKTNVKALLVYNQDEPLSELRRALETQPMETHRARTCRQATDYLHESSDRPHVIFTDTTLPDGTWEDVLRVAREAPSAADVVVISRWPDVKVYIDALERGAFDFMTPPFREVELDHVLRCATTDVAARRASAGAA